MQWRHGNRLPKRTAIAQPARQQVRPDWHMRQPSGTRSETPASVLVADRFGLRHRFAKLSTLQKFTGRTRNRSRIHAHLTFLSNACNGPYLVSELNEREFGS